MTMLVMFSMLNIGFIVFHLVSWTTANTEGENEIALLNNQNAPLFVSLDMSKANKNVKHYVDEAITSQMEDIEDNVKEIVSDIEKNISVSVKGELRIKEEGYENLTAIVTDNTARILQISQEFKYFIETTKVQQKQFEAEIQEFKQGYDNLSIVVTKNTIEVQVVQEQLIQMATKLTILEKGYKNISVVNKQNSDRIQQVQDQLNQTAATSNIMEKGYNNLTFVVQENTEQVRQVQDEQKQLSARLLYNLEKVYYYLTFIVQENTKQARQVQDEQKQLSARLNRLEKAFPQECADINFIQDGVFTIYPMVDMSPKLCYCVFHDNRKWTVIQRRFDISVNFSRSWDEYKEGFGDTDGEYWLGNELIHAISNNGLHKARVILGENGTEKYADYSNFLVGDEQSKYMLNVSGYSGTAGNSLSYHSGQKFSTFNQDNDLYSESCAILYQGGWWFNACCLACLNQMGYSPIDWHLDMGSHVNESMLMITKQ